MLTVAVIDRRRLAARLKSARRYQTNSRRRELEKARAKAWYHAHRAAAIARQRAWQAVNPDRVRAAKHNVRVRREYQMRDWKLTTEDLQRLVERDVTCYLCGMANHPGTNSVDHVIALARGGGHVYENLKVVHLKCNTRKGAREFSSPT